MAERVYDLKDKLIMRETQNNFIMEFDWMLTNACNFRCDYCHPNIAVHKNELPQHGKTPDQIAEAFLKIGQRLHLSMSGGEPLMFPEFSEFCRTITRNGHSVSMNTNLSYKDEIIKFAEIIDPAKVGIINAALHKMERDRQELSIESFAEDIVRLQDRGFNVQVFYVLYPPLLDSFEEDAVYLRSLGVAKIAGKIFKGVYQKRSYPAAYSPTDRIKILNYANNSYPVTAEYLEDKQHAFKGLPCAAGMSFFKVEVNGNVQRCPSNKEKFGNIYEGTFQAGIELKPCLTTKVMSVSQCSRFAVSN